MRPFDAISTYLATCAKDRKFSGCVCWIGNDKESFFFEAHGYAQRIPTKIPVNSKTVFDLASLTKPLATALAVMHLYERRKIALDDTVKKFLPYFAKQPNGAKTIRELLTHTTGMPGWFPLYVLPRESRMIFLAQANTGSQHVVYSCLGYILLGMIVEKIAGCSLGEYCDAHIYRKAGLRTTMFKPHHKQNIAATEYGNRHEKKLSAKYGTVSLPWREKVIRGEVHDGNSYYCFDGISGNAGLFSNADDLVTLMRLYRHGDIVRPAVVKAMTRDWTGGPQQRGLGWVINPFPRFCSSGTYYHTGFTGTMMLVDPKKRYYIVLLTNAVHPYVQPNIMAPIRQNIVRLVSRAIAEKH